MTLLFDGARIFFQHLEYHFLSHGQHLPGLPFMPDPISTCQMV